MTDEQLEDLLCEHRGTIIEWLRENIKIRENVYDGELEIRDIIQ